MPLPLLEISLLALAFHLLDFDKGVVFVAREGKVEGCLQVAIVSVLGSDLRLCECKGIVILVLLLGDDVELFEGNVLIDGVGGLSGNNACSFLSF